MLSAMKFQIILWGMAQLLKFAAWRYPAFHARLKERNLVAQLKARDEEIGRWYAIRDGKLTSGAGLRADADVTLAFKTAAMGADLLMPPINWLDQINAQKDFKLTVDGPEDLTNWFAQTIMLSQSAGLEDRHQARRRHHALLQHDQRRAGLRLCQGRQDHPHDADRSGGHRRLVVDDRGARPQAHAAAQDHAGAAWPECQVDRLLARSAALSDEARRLRSERRAQSAETAASPAMYASPGRRRSTSSPARSSGSSAPMVPA